MMKLIRLFCIFSLLISCAAVMHAGENAVEPTESKISKPKNSVPKLSDTEITKLIEQLDSDSFMLREAAVKDLTTAGMPAVPKVMEAAEGESLEASTRAFDVLDKWISGEDQLVKVAAKGALEKLASGDEKSKVVRRSKALLAKSNAPTYSPPNATLFGARPAVMPLRVARAGVARVELRAVAGVAAAVRGRTMRVSIANGKKTIRVTEGDTLQVTIVEDKEIGIQIKITEKDKDGKEKTSKYAAKDLDELKEKHPEGHKVYEKYAGKLTGLKIQMQAVKARDVPKPVEKPAVQKAIEDAKDAGDKAADAE